jgi:holo-[acyl-carrier protein] synthase
MILGIGTDIVEVGRIRSSWERFGERFASRILLEGEASYCRSHKDPAPFIAARFAAKEAISKAFGTGIGRRLGWHDIEIRKRESGEPFVELHGKGINLLKERAGSIVHISISHTNEHATAFAVLEK